MNSEHLDCLIIGAGISGIGAAHHFQRRFPSKSYAILEARNSLGGTWDLFTYPGIRSDSDMYTFSYSFRPWQGQKPVAEGAEILAYLRDAAKEVGIDRRIRYGHRVTRASWSKKEVRWTVESIHAETGARHSHSCRFLFMCTGYYDGQEGYTPAFPGVERFGGRIVHPQRWTRDIDYANKRVVVIGSGATAMTLVPALAKTAASVTMLQRSPTYILSLPNHDRMARKLRQRLPARTVAVITRWRNAVLNTAAYAWMRRYPQRARQLLIEQVEKQLRGAADVERHFTPTYMPWDQRLCLVPDGDLFEAIRDGRASVVTDHIESFTETGIKLRSGSELAADLIVTATGLKIKFLGGVAVTLDGAAAELNQRVLYRGVMWSGVPNLFVIFGYHNASWTLRCDLACEYLCRVLGFMDQRGYAVCEPPSEPNIERRPVLNLMAGYIQRGLDLIPQQGTAAPWRIPPNYLRDWLEMKLARPNDGVLRFSA